MTVARAYVSIGEVLNELREEFPDVTISKIRFLESQGLVEPQRSPSGYRRFYRADIERLRFILRQQKEHFLPLKVIKEKLDEVDREGGFANEDQPAPDASSPRRRGRKTSTAPALFEETRRARDAQDAREVVKEVRDDDAVDDLAPADSGVSLNRTELAQAAGITDAELGQLEEYGLVVPSHTARDRVLFDEDALAVARVAGTFMRNGIEPRHLRMYRAFAEREASLFEQVLLPYRRQRSPEARARTAEKLGELAGLGRRLRTALLRQSVRRVLGG